MKKQFLAVAALAITSVAYGQVGINTTTPATTLDITAKNATGPTTAVDGLMIPRVDRQRAQNMNSVPVSTMIYVNSIATGAASGIAVNIDAVGFYYYDGTAWAKMGSGAGAAVTANNGLTQTSGNIQLGGALTQATTISGLSATNTLNISDGPLRLLNGGVSNASTGNEQLLFGFQGTQTYKHAIKTRHNNLAPRGNAFDFYTWKSGTDAITDTGTQLVMTLDGNGTVGIGNSTPNATLDITATAATGTNSSVDGILIPRVTRERARSMNSVPVSTLVYITEATTGTQTNSTQFVDAAGFYYSDGANWQKMGASAAPVYQNIRGNVNVLPSSTLSYTVLPADYMVVTTAGSGVTINLPALTAADAGRTFLLYNDNSAAVANTVVGLDSGSTGGNLQKGRNNFYIWTGTKWITGSAQ